MESVNVSRKTDSRTLYIDEICAIILSDRFYLFEEIPLEVAHGTGKLAEI